MSIPSVSSLEQLPPHDVTAERAALACVVEAGNGGSQSEVEQQLTKLRPIFFYDLKHRNFYCELVRMRMAGHAVDAITIQTWFNTHNKWPEVGNVDYWQTTLASTALPGMTYLSFPTYLDTLEKLSLRRWCATKGFELTQQAQHGDIDVANLRAEFSEALETIDKATDRERPLLKIVTVAEIKAYVPEPKTFLIGADMVSLGELTVIAGLPGLGKSRLANTLAFAGARGHGEWMGYAVRRRFRTLVLQSENSMRRMQSEVQTLSDDVAEWVRFSEPTALMFSSPDFRQAVRRYYETWPFDLLLIDPWSDVVRDEKFSDYQEALENVNASVPAGDKRPAVLIVAHLKKSVLGDKRLTGRQLMGQVSGSMRLMQKARTAFMLQPATDDIEDDRVIFDCGKSNNDVPLPMSAWHRRNGEFLICPGFDFDQWLNPPDDGGNKAAPTEADMAKLFAGRKALKKVFAKELEAKGYSTASVYRWLNETNGKFREFLAVDGDGLMSWKA
jgi:hypothetical protein